MKISVVIPVYNEEERITGLLKDLKKFDLETFIVDDGSRDETYERVKKLSFPRLKILRHKVNLGKGAALKTGCIEAFNSGADAVVVMDGDGQHKVSDLAGFIKALNTKNVDVVFGSRNLNLGVPLIRFLGNKLAAIFISLFFRIYVSDLLCGYRAFNKKAFKKINWQSVGYGVETEMVVKVGKYKLRSCEIPVETVYYDKFKGATVLDAAGILLDVFRWRIEL